MQLGTIITLIAWRVISLSDWFKKENFKIEKSNVMATNKLKLRKMEIEMGLGKSKNVLPESKEQGLLAKVLPSIIEKLPEETISGLIERFIPVGEEGDYDEGGGLESMLLNFAKSNPKMVEGLLQGLTDGGQNEAQAEAPEYTAQV